MRSVSGCVVLPPDAPRSTAVLLLVEVRDVSLMDAPSVVVAETRAGDVAIEPGGQIPFDLAAPDALPGHSLAVRAHLSLDGTAAVSSGDLVSVTHLALPSSGDSDGMEIPVRIV
jgi:uncharacterized lipoprotein YbaY